MPDLAALLHTTPLLDAMQKELVHRERLLTLAEDAYHATPTLETAAALAQAELNYLTALHNRDAVNP